ncbi:MAG: ribosome recycling factor [Bacteroidota bacterium]|nr:ribosome recycling factor [Bacteroidota bacterium]
MPIDAIIKDASTRMDKSVESLRNELHRIRTGKATTALLDAVKVTAYGSVMPLNKVANISVRDVHTLNVQPWDRSLIPLIEKAILSSDLGLNPVNDGTVIRVPIPPLTAERRRDLVKLVRRFGEETKVALRNIRRDANEHLKKAEKEEHISEDERKKAEKRVQDLTDKHIETVDRILEAKESEIMEV